MQGKGIICLGVWAAVLLSVTWPSYAAETQREDDWSVIWERPMPAPVQVEVKQLGGLGKDLENMKWQMVSTRYHQIHYQPTTDRQKVSEVYSLIDNVYMFLEGRSPRKPQTPIKVFLVPGQSGRSRCSRAANAMRTGDQGDPQFLVTSLLHEETHLFNFAFLDDIMQGWWAGEFYCQYYQQRALWEAQGKDIKSEIASRLPDGPQCRLSEIDNRGKNAFDEALSALYFFEQKYGRERSIRFRRACLAESKKTRDLYLRDSVFADVFGQKVNQLEREWLEFYGWRAKRARVKDRRLDKRVSYTTDKASVQNVVRALADKAGLEYDWTKSQAQAGTLCRRWVRNVRIKTKPLREALREVLDPVGLTYDLEGDAVVLRKK